MPNPREDRERAIGNYTEFMSSLGMDVKKPVSIPKGVFPGLLYKVPDGESVVSAAGRMEKKE